MPLSGCKLLASRLIALLLIAAISPATLLLGAFEEPAECCRRHGRECKCAEMCPRTPKGESPKPTCHGSEEVEREKPRCSLSGCSRDHEFQGLSVARAYLFASPPTVEGPRIVGVRAALPVIAELRQAAAPPYPPPRV